MGRLKQFWTDLRSSLWFLPGLIVAAFVAAAFELIAVDQRIGTAWAERWPRIFAADAEGSRAMLSAIAGSMITIAGVGFSITIVALAQASTQYSPRVLRNFMRDRSNQVVLGMFVGVFAYCLVVLRNIVSGTDGEFVPALAVFIGFLLSIVGVGSLIYFIHHIATSIQASHMLASITAETITALERTCRETATNAAPQKSEPPGEDWFSLVSDTTGYLQRIEVKDLVALACKNDITIKMAEGVGQFVIQDQPFAWASRKPAESVVVAVNNCCAVGEYRTVDQDAGFGIRQIVDIALKALSPGINDTGTAISCLDYLSAILCRMANMEFEPLKHYADGKLRLVVQRRSFADFVNDAFDQILENATKNKAVLLHAVSVLERLSNVTQIERRRGCLQPHLQSVRELCANVVPSSAKEEIEKRVDEVSKDIMARNDASAHS